MHQRLIALALAAAMLLASCGTTQTLPVPQDRVPQVVEGGQIEVENEAGERKTLEVVRVESSATARPRSHIAHRPRGGSSAPEPAVHQTNESATEEFTNVEVEVPEADGRARMAGFLGAGSFATMYVGFSPDPLGVNGAFLLVGSAASAWIAGIIGAATAPAYRLPD